MDLFVLDSLYRKIAVVDTFESLIWTERFSDDGDFELKLSSTFGNRNLFTAGTRLAIDGSTRVMEVQTVQDSNNEDGEVILDVKGPSLEYILDHRVAYKYGQNYATTPTWNITDTPGNIARAVFDAICRNNTTNVHDNIPNLAAGSLYPSSPSIAETTTTQVAAISPQSVKSVVKGLCDANELGYRLVRSDLNNQLYFDVYPGADRTTRQSSVTPIIFAASLDDLQNTTELKTTQGAKNVAVVFHPTVGLVTVYADHTPTDVDGFERRELFVDASSLDATLPDLNGRMIDMGQAALATTKASSLFDGEINQYSQFKYEIDYYLGDLVELRNKDGIVTYKRITEQITVSDANGDRSYPTLEADLFAGENDWLSFETSTKVWNDYDALPTAWGDLD